MLEESVNTSCTKVTDWPWACWKVKNNGSNTKLVQTIWNFVFKTKQVSGPHGLVETLKATRHLPPTAWKTASDLSNSDHKIRNRTFALHTFLVPILGPQVLQHFWVPPFLLVRRQTGTQKSKANTTFWLIHLICLIHSYREMWVCLEPCFVLQLGI